MKFLLEENVPSSVLEILERGGYEAQFVRDIVPPGAEDQVVATVAEQLDSVLVTFDGDFRKIAPRIPIGFRNRFRKLSKITFRCPEPMSATRLEGALDWIEAEYRFAQQGSDTRMIVTVGRAFLRTER